MGTYDDDRIRKLELEILVLQAENRRLTSTLADAAAQHYDGQLAALLGES